MTGEHGKCPISSLRASCHIKECLTLYRPAMPHGKKSDLFSSVLSKLSKYHPSGNLKFNYLGIFQSLKFRILMEKIPPISLKLNFTPNTLGCYGLRYEGPNFIYKFYSVCEGYLTSLVYLVYFIPRANTSHVMPPEYLLVERHRFHAMTCEYSFPKPLHRFLRCSLLVFFSFFLRSLPKVAGTSIGAENCGNDFKTRLEGKKRSRGYCLLSSRTRLF